MGLKQRFFKEDLKQLTEVEWLTETGSWFQKQHWTLDFVQKDGQGSNNTRTEKDALNLCLEGPTKKVPGFLCVFYIIYMVGVRGGYVQTSCSHPTENVVNYSYHIFCLKTNSYLLLTLLLTRTVSQTLWGTGTQDYTGYFNISAQPQTHQHTPNTKIAN